MNLYSVLAKHDDHGTGVINLCIFLSRRLQNGGEFEKATTATATSLNKRFNEQNNGCARALKPFV